MISSSRLFCVRFAGLGVLAGLLTAAGFAQDAKQLYEQSLVEGNSCKKMQLACQAAKIDPKKKDYTDACDRFKTSTNRSDETFRLKAIDALSKNDYAGAARWTNSFVCSAETKQTLLSQIADAQKSAAPAAPAPAPAQAAKAEVSAASLAEARTSFQEGHFDVALASAQKVTDPNLKPIADDIVGRINNYRAAVAAAHQAEAGKDYAGALNSWRQAQGIDANGPDSPASNIARLEPLAHPAPAPAAAPAAQAPVQVAKNNSPPSVAKQAPPPPVDTGAQVAKLMDDASKAEQANNLAAAVRSYDAVLRIEPNNTQATFNKAALLAKINSDPAEQAKSLAQAIQDFYASKYADAEDALRAYLDAPTAKSKGAAYFYMGATRLYEKVLNGPGQKPDVAITNPDVLRPFKDARAAGYQPVARFVSPLVMRAWQSVQ